MAGSYAMRLVVAPPLLQVLDGLVVTTDSTGDHHTLSTAATTIQSKLDAWWEWHCHMQQQQQQPLLTIPLDILLSHPWTVEQRVMSFVYSSPTAATNSRSGGKVDMNAAAATVLERIDRVWDYWFRTAERRDLVVNANWTASRSSCE